MATNLTRDKPGEAMASQGKGPAIGETDASVFNCPSCARPLSDGTSKCPGCGTRLIMGVRVKRAISILVLGAVVGVLGGGVATASAITLSLRAATPVAVAAPSASPVPPTAAPTAVLPLAPSGATVSALSGTAVVNGRIALDADTLAAALASRTSTTIEIARALRSLAADATLGIDLAGRLDPWPDATSVALRLSDFYGAMADTARAALRTSLTDEATYRKSGAQMMAVLAELDAVDAASRSLATTVDLELPPVARPGASAAPDASTTP
jgi:hypothetical protein